MSKLVIINGEEEFLKERAAFDEAKSNLVDDILVYTEDEIDQYNEEIQTPTLFGGSRAYIIKEPKEIPDLPPNKSDVVILISGKKKLSDGRARVLDFPKLKTYDNNNEVIKWIINEGSIFNIDLTRVAGALFVSNGKGLRKLASEIKKLAAITKPGEIVTPNDFKSVACFSAELNPKHVVDPMCEGNTLKALAFYDRLQQAGDETGWIIAYMQRHTIQQFKVETLRRKNVSLKDIAGILDIHPFAFQKMQETRLGRWTPDVLLESLNTLCDLDLAHKRGDNAAQFGLESEIIKLAEIAKSHAAN